MFLIHLLIPRLWIRLVNFLKRIWTLSNNYNFKLGDLHLPIWYLPAEKEKGLRELFHELTNPDSVFWLSKAPSAVFFR